MRISKKIMSNGRKATVRIAWSTTQMWDPRDNSTESKAYSRAKWRSKAGIIYVRGTKRADEVIKALRFGADTRDWSDLDTYTHEKHMKKLNLRTV